MKIIDALTEDPPIPNQSWFCVSFLSPEGIQNCSLRSLKVRGSYSSRQEAEDRADYLRKHDPDYDIFVGEIGKWCPWDPDPNSQEAGETIHHDAKMQELHKNYLENKKKAAIQEAERKREMTQEAVRREATKSTNKTHERLQKKLHEKNKDKVTPNPTPMSVSDIPPSPELSNEVKEEAKRLTENEKIITQAKDNITSIDDKLNRLQQLHKNLVDRNYS